MKPGSEFLFVYGTLMHGYENPFAKKLHESATFVGKGTFPGFLYRVEWYPGAVFINDSDSLVSGEVYHITDFEKIIPDLDDYEEILEDKSQSLYLRKIIPVTLEDQSILDCWTYLFNQPVEGLLKIASGNFRKM